MAGAQTPPDRDGRETIATVTATPPTRPSPEPLGRRTWLLIAIALVPLVVAAARVLTSLGDGFHATSDNAINELLVRDLWRHVVLTGPFSRGEWSHPGPLFYYLSWPTYRVFGSNSTAMLIDALVINGASVGVMIAIAKRWGGFSLALPVALATGALVLRLPTDFLANPWNPYVTVLPFGAFLLTAWAASCGDRPAFAVAVFIGSFCAQTHIGYAPLVAPLLVWCAWRVIRDRRANGLAGLGWAAATLVVVLFPPLLDQMTRHPGNLHAIASYFAHPDGPKHSITDGLRVLAGQFSGNADWLAGYRGANPYNAEPLSVTEAMPIPFLLAGFVVAVVVAFRSRRRADLLLGIALLIPIVAGVVAVAQTVGSIYEYRLRWTWVLGALATAFTVAEAGRVVRRHISARGTKVAGAAAVAGVVAFAALGSLHTMAIHPVRLHHARQVRALANQVVRRLPGRSGVVLVKTDGSFSANGDIPGLILNLERASIPVRLSYTYANKIIYGAHRIHRRHERVRARLLLTTDSLLERTAAQPGARQLAFVSDSTPTQRSRAVLELESLVARGAKPFSPKVLAAKRRIEALAVYVVPAAGY